MIKFVQRLAAIGALLMTAVLSASFPAQALEKVRILIPVRSIDEAFSPFTVAKYLGYFEAEGLDVSLLPVGGSNETAIQISAGNAELGAASPGESLIGIQSGQLHIRYFFDLYYANIWSLAVPVDSPLKSVEELKGKRIGVQAMGSAGITFARAFAKSAGLNPQKDIGFMPIGMGAQAVTAVNQHVVDAIVFWDAALAKFDVSGLKLRMLPVAESIRSLPDVGLIARDDMIEKNPKMLAAVARAVAKGYDFSIANPEAAVLISLEALSRDKAQKRSAGGGASTGRLRQQNADVDLELAENRRPPRPFHRRRLAAPRRFPRRPADLACACSGRQNPHQRAGR